jgi:PAS domain S-box-containing protein
MPKDETNRKLLQTIDELRSRLDDAQETLRAIQHGEVDALVVSTPQGEQIYTISGAEKPYRVLIEEMKEGAIILSDDNTILYCNSGFAKMMARPMEKIVGSRIQNLVLPTHLTDFEELLAQGRTGKGAISKEITLQANGSKLVPTNMSISSLETDSLMTTFLVVTDLTEHMEGEVKRYTLEMERTLEERARELKKAERFAAIGETAGMVGHDIRNPLQSILGELYLIRTELNSCSGDEKSKICESLDMIESQIDYVNKIVLDLQDFAKPLNPIIQETNLKHAVEDLLMKTELPQNILASSQIQDEAKKIMADPTFLRRILQNLISNAIQAMPNGGKLCITAAQENDNITINVEDTGVGIPKEIQPKLFMPLVTTKAKGQGFGLAVVKRLTEGMGGTVSFESELGNGTKFIIQLPSRQ